MLIVDHGNVRHYGVSPVLLLMKFYLQCQKKKNCFSGLYVFYFNMAKCYKLLYYQGANTLTQLTSSSYLYIVYCLDYWFYIYIYIYIYINVISKLTDAIDKKVTMVFTLILGGPQSDNNTRFCIFCIETKPWYYTIPGKKKE